MTATATTRDTVAVRGNYTHHGRTVASWAGAIIALLAFIVGCIGFILLSVPLIIGGVSGLVLALIVTQVLRVLGHGAD